MHEPPQAFIDAHATTIAASRERVWQVLGEYVDSGIVRARHPMLGRVLGLEPASGFAVVREASPNELVLAGRHRFADYAVVLELTGPTQGPTTLTLRSYADFVGLRGLAYRSLVVGSRGHLVAVRSMLAAVRRRCRVSGADGRAAR